VTGEVREAHASRIRFYADKDFMVSEEELAHVSHHDQEHVVEESQRCRFNQEQKLMKFGEVALSQRAGKVLGACRKPMGRCAWRGEKVRARLKRSCGEGHV
jgi:hypothetical protein